MQVRRLPFFVAALALLLTAPLARATTVLQPTFEELVGSAESIVRVQVLSVDSAWRDNPAKPGERYIGTKVTLNVREVIKGKPPQTLVLDLVGGRVGADELVVDGAPKFEAGDECILFVRGNGRSFFPVVGLMHGYFPVYRDAVTGRAQVLRFNGVPLHDEQELAPGAPTLSASRAPGLTPESFRDRILLQQQRINLSRENQK
jgi:hypothetical protein